MTMPLAVRGRAGIGPGMAVMVAIGLVAAGWILTVDQIDGMDMGTYTRIGSFGRFLAMWTPMMVAMMLPSAIPTIWSRAKAGGTTVSVPVFVGLYTAVWVAAGTVVYLLYRPHGTSAAGVLVLAAGMYELTPIKRHFRQGCLDRARSGLGFGLDCVGSTGGLMVAMMAVGYMNLTWMAAITALVVAQKVLPVKPLVDIPVGLAIAALGYLILVHPSALPGIVPSMSMSTHMSM